MDWHLKVLEVIDLRSFSNLWFWIALAVMWSTTSHWVLGVPYDMVTRAARSGGRAETDLEDLVRINTNRLLFIANESGFWLVMLGSFLLAAIASLGFAFGVELAQALFLMLMPMSLVGLLSVRAASRIQAREAVGADLRKMLQRHRLSVQVVGMISIFVTALWGMYQNFSVGALG
ncbi:component of SufBCD complex [Litorisediminicola beolgyonensis]|uniref:Component of SufBCD complex n=1 Tax=Litorisediminicola beolgyonensis TaxID=1173614 RepID=A0ABW3ZGS4_9RHOB